ncbi:hypothetical protein MMC09_002710 [Bachmanniomyces sp. S44760]|nr:hypothetical protein [Bachmanniomyces sp. S44760]
MAVPASEWSSSFWDCFSPGSTCLAATCCGPCLFGKIKARRDNPTLQGFSYCNGSCVGWYFAACCGIQGVLQYFNRADMRVAYNINGSTMGDLAASVCCGCCAMVQEEKELLLRNGLPGAGAVNGNGAVAVGYQGQKEGMQYGA